MKGLKPEVEEVFDLCCFRVCFSLALVFQALLCRPGSLCLVQTFGCGSSSCRRSGLLTSLLSPWFTCYQVSLSLSVSAVLLLCLCGLFTMFYSLVLSVFLSSKSVYIVISC